MELHDASFPGRTPIDAYGNGGFRFAGMSHRGSLLFLPSGVHEWRVEVFDQVDSGALARVIEEAPAIELLLLGSGSEIKFLPERVRAALTEAGIAVDVMTTGAAARTFNVLLAEERAVAAGLIAVENP